MYYTRSASLLTLFAPFAILRWRQLGTYFGVVLGSGCVVGLFYENSKSSSAEQSFLDIMEHLIARSTAEELQLAVIVARQIWFRRNSMVFQGNFRSPQSTLRAAKDQLEAHHTAARQVVKHRSNSSRPATAQWQKPSLGTTKVNWDAAVDSKGRRIGIGVIVRDHEGEVLAMLCETMSFINDPATAEGLAARRGVELSIQMDIRKIELEGDAKQIVQALQSEGEGWQPYGLIIEDMKLLLRGFQEYKVNHIPREANEEAHKLAKLALTLGENRIWREDFPL